MNTDDKRTADAAKERGRKPKEGETEEEKIDEAVEESFPASDPPSTSMPHRDE